MLGKQQSRSEPKSRPMNKFLKSKKQKTCLEEKKIEF